MGPTFQSVFVGIRRPSVLVILPVILLFFLAQRTFIRGIATTGLKG